MKLSPSSKGRESVVLSAHGSHSWSASWAEMQLRLSKERAGHKRTQERKATLPEVSMGASSTSSVASFYVLLFCMKAIWSDQLTDVVTVLTWFTIFRDDLGISAAVSYRDRCVGFPIGDLAIPRRHVMLRVPSFASSIPCYHVWQEFDKLLMMILEACVLSIPDESRL